MTPREPDRFDIDSLMRRGLSKDAAISLSRDVAAALRQAESSALERAAQICRRVASEEAPRSQVGKHAALRCEELIGYALRALIPPAAAPATEVRNDPCQRCGKLGGHPVDFRFDGILMGSWICPHCLAAQEKRIAELEAALRDARVIIAELNGAAALGWVLSVDALLAARAAPPKGEGT